MPHDYTCKFYANRISVKKGCSKPFSVSPNQYERSLVLLVILQMILSSGVTLLSFTPFNNLLYNMNLTNPSV